MSSGIAAQGYLQRMLPLQTQTSPILKDYLDVGIIKDSVYHNNYFGMTVELPPDWDIQDLGERQRMMDTVSLFSVFKCPVGAPVAYNSNIQCWAEQVDQWPGIQSGKDYLFHLRRTMEAGQMEISFPREIYVKSIGGHEFHAMQSRISIAGMTISHNSYSTIIKDHALSFSISFKTRRRG